MSDSGDEGPQPIADVSPAPESLILQTKQTKMHQNYKRFTKPKQKNQLGKSKLQRKSRERVWEAVGADGTMGPNKSQQRVHQK
jgi:hypothetical protein